MGFDQYHEPPNELPAETRTFARMILSVIEEAQAIDWYEQRMAVEPDKEARAIYDEKVKNLAPQEEVRARHILVKSEDEAKKVSEELRAGKDFDEVAKSHSQGKDGESGDLGYFSRGQMVKPFEDAAFALEKGKISDPVQTEYGWHVLKVEDKRNREPPSFDEVKDQITSSLINTKLQSTIQDLRQNGKIDVIDPEIKKAMESDSAPSGDPVAGEKAAEEPKK